MKENFKTYKASAGSGKTTSLVAEYLSICLHSEHSLNQYRHILAITFTINATAEMKERIVHTLNEFAFLPQEQWGGSEKAIFAMICKSEPQLDLPTVQSRSERLLANILYDYPNFSISTIDSFFQRIVRAFAFELGISMSYQVEVTLDDFYQQAVDLLMSRISNDNPQLRDRIFAIANEQLETDGWLHLEDFLCGVLASTYEDEQSAEPLAALSALENRTERIANMQRAAWNEHKKLQDMASEAKNFLPSLSLEMNDMVGKSIGIWKWFNSFDTTSNAQCSGAENVIENGGSILQKHKAADVELNDRIIDKYRDLYARRKAALSRHTLLKNVKSLFLLFDLKDVLDEIRDRDDKFFLADTNHLIHSEIKESDTPFIYEKIGNKYTHFFIDEFQDTSRMQWENAVPLLKNALATPENQVILFGDVKQAIYRFRNGDSQLFADLTNPNDANEYGKLLPNDASKSAWKNVALDTNYRSGGNIIKFNNLFFKYLTALNSFASNDEAKSAEIKRLYETYYDGVAQKIPEWNEKKGTVIVQFNPQDDNNYQVNQVLAAVDYALNECHFREKDIAVLSSSRAVASELGRALAEKGHAVLSSDSLLLSSSPEVNLMISVLHYIVRPNDLLSRFEIMNYAINHSKSDGMDNMAPFIDSLHDENAFLKTIENFGFQLDRKSLEPLSLYEILVQCVKIFHLDDADAFVIEFFNNVLSYIGNKNGEVVAFLHWWDKNGSGLKLAAPASANAITISTIHASKGLQYPVVILPWNKFAYNVTKKNFWYRPQPEDDCELPYLSLGFNKSLEHIGMSGDFMKEQAMSVLDSLNKIYVAHTRPKQMLYIITGAATAGNYSKYLNDFIHGNLIYNADTNAKIAENEDDKCDLTVQSSDADDAATLLPGWQEIGPGKFIFGDNHLQCEVKEESKASDTFSKMYRSDFQLSQLSTHLFRTETLEQQIGNALHEYFSSLQEFPLTEAAVDAWTFDEQQPFQEEIRAALRTIAADEHWHPYFAPGVRVLNEIPILPTAAQLAEESKHVASRPQLTFRPDRVVLLPNETVVIDYKTGHPTEKAREAYERQVARYVKLLQTMGFPNVRGELLYF